MYLFEISVNIENKEKKEEIVSLLWNLISSWLHNGQIINKDVQLFYTNLSINFIVYCPESNSLDLKFANKYVLNDYNKLIEVSGESLIKRLLGKEVDYIETDFDECCLKAEFYILFTHMFSEKSPICCGECRDSIPLYRIIKDKNIGILTWQDNYKSCDTLQINSRAGEKFGLKEMTNFDSSLTKQGLEVCKELELILNKPVFYYLFNYRNIPYKKDIKRKCPVCNGEWILNEPLHNIFNFKCDKCKLLSSFTCNPR